MNNTLSKEEVLDKHIDISFDSILELNYGQRADGIHAAMDEYAKQEVIEFDGWKRGEKIYHGLFDKDNGMWYYSSGELAANNTAELYEQYLLHKQNKEQ